MSLLDQFAEPFCVLNKISAPDGFGGFYYTWKDGVSFQAAANKRSSTDAIVAEREAGKDIFDLIFDKHIVLTRGDRIRNTKTGYAYEVTSDSRDAYTPGTSTLQKATCTAERVTL